MGNTFEVWSWICGNPEEKYENRRYYEYQLIYAGEDFDEMIKVAKEEKEKGIGCVKMLWR